MFWLCRAAIENWDADDDDDGVEKWNQIVNKYEREYSWNKNVELLIDGYYLCDLLLPPKSVYLTEQMRILCILRTIRRTPDVFVASCCHLGIILSRWNCSKTTSFCLCT